MTLLTESQKAARTKTGYIGKGFNRSGARKNTRTMRTRKRKAQRAARRP